jgi:hypothetical protein
MTVEQAPCHVRARGIFIHHSRWLADVSRDTAASTDEPKYTFSMRRRLERDEKIRVFNSLRRIASE